MCPVCYCVLFYAFRINWWNISVCFSTLWLRLDVEISQADNLSILKGPARIASTCAGFFGNIVCMCVTSFDDAKHIFSGYIRVMHLRNLFGRVVRIFFGLFRSHFKFVARRSLDSTPSISGRPTRILFPLWSLFPSTRLWPYVNHQLGCFYARYCIHLSCSDW